MRIHDNYIAFKAVFRPWGARAPEGESIELCQWPRSSGRVQQRCRSMPQPQSGLAKPPLNTSPLSSGGAFGGPGGGFGGPGGGFLGSSKSSGKATTETTKKKATTRTSKTIPRATEN